MKVTNTTRYPTALLRTIICRAHAENAKSRGRLRTWGRVEIKIRRSLRGSYTSGHAYLNGTYAVLTLPAPTCTAAQLYRLAWHELQHLYGYRHSNMGLYYPPDEETQRECAGLPERMTEEPRKPKAKPDRQQTAYTRTLAAIKRWETKAKRAETALKKLRRRQAYYEKTMKK